MSFNIWVTEQPAYAGVGVVPPAFQGGHVLDMVYDRANQFIFTVDRYYDESDQLLQSRLHRFTTVFDWNVGIPHVEVESGSATQQFISVAIAAGALIVLRYDSDANKYYLEKRDPNTLNIITTLEVFECKITALTDGVSLWLISKAGIMKRLDAQSMTYVAEKSYPSNTDCGRAVYDPVMGVIVVPKKTASAEVYDALSGDHIGTAPFPWAGPDQFTKISIPPHGEQHGFNPPILALVEYDVGLAKAKLVLFQRDTENRNYTNMLVEIPFCVGNIAPNGQAEGYRGLEVLHTTIDTRPPGSDIEASADASRLANRAIVIARNGVPPSSESTPLEYFVGRRVDLTSYLTAPAFAAGLPECNPHKRRAVLTNETAKLWLASASLDSAEQRQYPSCTLAV